MKKVEPYDYAIKIRFEWDRTKRTKTLGMVLSARMPICKPDYDILTKQETDVRIKELLPDIVKIFWDKYPPDVYYVRDNIEKDEFILKMNSKWSKEEESEYLNKRLRSISTGILCHA